MRTRYYGISALIVSLLASTVATAQLPSDLPLFQARGQQPTESIPFVKSAPIAPTPLPEGVTPTTQAVPDTQTIPAKPSSWVGDSWLNTTQPGCWGPLGKNGPIGYELFLRTGPNVLVGGGPYKQALKTGWEVNAGGRSLFFNPEGSAAWTVELGLVYTYNSASNGPIFSTLGGNFKVRSMDRTSGSLGFGRDWFYSAPAFVGGGGDWNFRYGFDGGARWGTSHIDLTPAANFMGYARHQDNYGEGFIGAHANMEVPMGNWIFLLGLRGEFAYTDANLLPGYSTSLYNLNFLFTSGFRF